MTILEIYDKLNAIGCLSFSTINGQTIESRIAHFYAADEDGLHFRTMHCKPFYNQLIETSHVSVCGMYPQTQVAHDKNHLPYFKPGYTMRVSGDVREMSLAELEKKAKNNPHFNVAIYDLNKYPTTCFFVLYKGSGEYYDYDYGMRSREHKILRKPFAFGGAPLQPAGFRILPHCIACGACLKGCSFKAIEKGTPYHILQERCDECGTCLTVCPSGAIVKRGE